MHKVYQTKFGSDGNCLQAAMASLLDMKLSKVPHFIRRKDWSRSFVHFLNKRGYFIRLSIKPNGLKYLSGIAGSSAGIEGYFIAFGYRLPEVDGLHAVISKIDTKTGRLKVVHDPFPSHLRAEDSGRFKTLELWVIEDVKKYFNLIL